MTFVSILALVSHSRERLGLESGIAENVSHAIKRKADISFTTIAIKHKNSGRKQSASILSEAQIEIRYKNVENRCIIKQMDETKG